MKKIYLFFTVVLVSMSTFAQVIEAEGKAQNGNYIYGLTKAAGSFITFTGSGFNEGDVVDGDLTNWSGWSKGTTIYGTGSATADASGNISGTISIDATTPVGPGQTGGTGYMIQLHRNGDELFATGKTFVNLVVEITAATDIKSGKIVSGSVYVTGNTLNIKDASAKTFEIFNLSGTVVEAGSINGSSVQIPLSLAKGIYIVKVGETTTKISL